MLKTIRSNVKLNYQRNFTNYATITQNQNKPQIIIMKFMNKQISYHTQTATVVLSKQETAAKICKPTIAENNVHEASVLMARGW